MASIQGESRECTATTISKGAGSRTAPAAIHPAFLTTLKPPGGSWWPAQVNLLQQRQALAPDAPRLVFGGDDAVAALCQQFGAIHVWPGDQQLPRLDALLAAARQTCPGASHLVYLNGDILLLPSFLTVLTEVAIAQPRFLLTGRLINIPPPGDLGRLDVLAHRGGSLGGIGALEVFAFPTAEFAAVPPLVIGRAGWDNWLVGEARRQAAAPEPRLRTPARR
jgi:hypothetical protein